VRVAVSAPLLLGSVKIASAQTIQPNDFVPAPDGTTINMVYFNGGRQGAFYNTSGGRVPNSSANLYEGFERLVHFDYVFGHPSGLPSFLYCTERLSEDGLLYQHFGEPLDEGA